MSKILDKIRLDDLKKILSDDVIRYNSCIEMHFCIDNDTVYKDSWLSKS